MTERPLYGAYGWAYDELFHDPVEPWVEVVRRAVPPPAELLDAGCGTGRHSAALAACGYAVTLVDVAPALLEQAAARLPEAPAVLADLRALDLGRGFDVIACRGVLNDVLDGRDEVLARFAAHLRPGGALVMDVRDLGATQKRYAGGRTTRRGAFESDGWMDGDLLRVVERFDGVESSATIRPWSRDEVEERLVRAGFASWELGVSPGRPDRTLVTARAPARSASPGGT